jgi:SAM-dependent methyltransferase
MQQLQAPSEWLVRFEPLLKRSARVLDVAAGSGRHSRWLCQQGHQVTAIDRDAEALSRSGASRTLCCDLENGDLPLRDESFDAVLVTNYLHRPLFGQLAAWLALEGVLIYETFAQGQEIFGRPQNRDFLLAPGELLRAFPQFLVVGYEHGIERRGQSRCVERLCAVRRAVPQELGGFTAHRP